MIDQGLVTGRLDLSFVIFWLIEFRSLRSVDRSQTRWFTLIHFWLQWSIGMPIYTTVNMPYSRPHFQTWYFCAATNHTRDHVLQAVRPTMCKSGRKTLGPMPRSCSQKWAAIGRREPRRWLKAKHVTHDQPSITKFGPVLWERLNISWVRGDNFSGA